MVATKEHCYYCFDVLIAHLEKKPLPTARFEDAKYPLFVTWNTMSRGEKHLRGCIGNFSPMVVADGLRQYAITSAVHDRRFNPINLRELPHLACSVSLLVDFEPGTDYLDWEIGTHGIWIEFVNDFSKVTTATYLPEVMPEQGWTKIEAIDSLLRKGGFRGKIDEAKRKSIVLTRYKSSKATATYEEYRRQK
ncbi:AMMECR1 domain-containing protein [Dichotomocladium elegans]|nr:AMMECR1 domain-containing protein [Dichotomocladium elegans]